MKAAFQERARVLGNDKISGSYFKMRLASQKIAGLTRPGQFINIKVNDTDEPLLRRPLSVHRADKLKMEILYEVVGEGTRALSQRKAGEYLDIIGPLGSGFDYRTSYIVHRTSLLIAGGIGVAPLVFLAEKLAKRCTKRERRYTTVLIGARGRNEILCEKEFKRLGFNVKIATDNGSGGFPGKVTDLLKHLLSANLNNSTIAANSTLYACGPRPMLKAIAKISKQYHIPAQVSLEEHMACGIGVCLGCAVKTKSGYQRVCKEGPVFEAQEIVWEK